MVSSPSIAIDALLHTLIAGLHRATDAQAGLMDALHEGPTPSDHYGQTSAALAQLVAPGGHWDSGRQALQAWLTTPDSARDHWPFNRLALGLMLLLDDGRLSPDERQVIQTARDNCPLRDDYPSNNWGLLAATCRHLEAEAPAQREASAAQLAALLARWTTAKGAFIDYPAQPLQGRGCTPLAYHHKALFLAALASRWSPHPGLVQQTQRLADWLVHCWDDAGYAGGYGRSHHALFGDGCLLAALILLGHDQADGPAERLAQRLLARQQRPDGLLWLEPEGARCATARWDDYMHLSVYNAWAAAVIGAARCLAARQPIAPALADRAWQANQPGWHHDEQAGLASWRDAVGNVAVLATHGQPPQLYRGGRADLRYAGGRVLHLRVGQADPVDLPPCLTGVTELRAAPQQAGMTALAQAEDQLLALDAFTLRHCEADAQGFRLALDGQAHPVSPPAPRGLLARALAAADWRLLDGRLGRRANLRRRSWPGLPDLKASVRIELRVSPSPGHGQRGQPGHHGHLSLHWQLPPSSPGLRWLNPAPGAAGWQIDTGAAPTPAQPAGKYP